MSRLPYAAKTLIRQVVDRFPDSLVTQSEPDGLNVSRTIGFEGDAATWLAPLLVAAADARIESHSFDEEATELHVTFANSIKADNSDQFLLPEVEAILAEPESNVVTADESPSEAYVSEAVADDEPAPKKRAPRKKASD